MSAAPSDAAPSDAAAAPPAPGEKQAARLPGWRGHHKLYLAAVALVAVCVWLIVCLWSLGRCCPTIVGFAAVVFQVTVKSGVFALLFARYVAGAGAVVAPADPEGKVGAAPGPRLGARGLRAGRWRARGHGAASTPGAARPANPDAAGLFGGLGVAGRAAGVRLRWIRKKCGWLPERREVEGEPCSGVNPCCEYVYMGDPMLEVRAICDYS